jgi:3-keto-5-aminohexanoate cleavage enzyme
MKPLIICAAVTGGAPPKSKTPHHPVTVDTVIGAAVECARAGAAIVHVHARRDDGSTTVETEIYRAIVDGITASGSDVIVNLSAGDNGGRADHESRLKVADVGAEMVSLDAGSFNIGERLYDNSPKYLRAMATRMRSRGVTPEIEILDLGHLDFIHTLKAEGMLGTRSFFQLVFGVPGGMPADPDLLPHLMRQLPEGAEWSMCAHTADHERHLQLQMRAFAGGGHVRTCMEDYVYLRPGELARTNAEMVEQWVSTARIWGRPVATAAMARDMLGMKPRC